MSCRGETVDVASYIDVRCFFLFGGQAPYCAALNKQRNDVLYLSNAIAELDG